MVFFVFCFMASDIHFSLSTKCLPPQREHSRLQTFPNTLPLCDVLLCISRQFPHYFSDHKHSEMYWVPVLRCWQPAGAAGAALSWTHWRLLQQPHHSAQLSLSARSAVALWKHVQETAKITGWRGWGGNKKSGDDPSGADSQSLEEPMLEWLDIPEGAEACGERTLEQWRNMSGKEQLRGIARCWLCPHLPGKLGVGSGVWRLWESERKYTTLRSVFFFVSHCPNLY